MATLSLLAGAAAAATGAATAATAAGAAAATRARRHAVGLRASQQIGRGLAWIVGCARQQACFIRTSLRALQEGLARHIALAALQLGAATGQHASLAIGLTSLAFLYAPHQGGIGHAAGQRSNGNAIGRQHTVAVAG